MQYGICPADKIWATSRGKIGFELFFFEPLDCSRVVGARPGTFVVLLVVLDDLEEEGRRRELEFEKEKSTEGKRD